MLQDFQYVPFPPLNIPKIYCFFSSTTASTGGTGSNPYDGGRICTTRVRFSACPSIEFLIVANKEIIQENLRIKIPSLCPLTKEKKRRQ